MGAQAISVNSPIKGINSEEVPMISMVIQISNLKRSGSTRLKVGREGGVKK